MDIKDGKAEMMILTVITLSVVLLTAVKQRQWGVLTLLLLCAATWVLAESIPPSIQAVFIGLFVATWQLLRNKPIGATHEKSNHTA